MTKNCASALGKRNHFPVTKYDKKQAVVADGEKSSKLIVCKSPGTNIENPGDAFMTLFASLT
jgi:hypothetical protein